MYVTKLTEEETAQLRAVGDEIARLYIISEDAIAAHRKAMRQWEGEKYRLSEVYGMEADYVHFSMCREYIIEEPHLKEEDD